MAFLAKADVNRPKIEALLLFDEIMLFETLVIFYCGIFKGIEQLIDIQSNRKKSFGFVIARHHRSNVTKKIDCQNLKYFVLRISLFHEFD